MKLFIREFSSKKIKKYKVVLLDVCLGIVTEFGVWNISNPNSLKYPTEIISKLFRYFIEFYRESKNALFITLFQISPLDFIQKLLRKFFQKLSENILETHLEIFLVVSTRTGTRLPDELF